MLLKWDGPLKQKDGDWASYHDALRVESMTLYLDAEIKLLLKLW